MKSATKFNETPQPYTSPELEYFQSMEETIDTDYIRTNMMLAAQIEDAMIAQKVGKKMLADRLGKKPSVITKWLSGTHNFEVKTLMEISKVLNIKFFVFDICPPEQKVILKAHITLNTIFEKPINVPNMHSEIYSVYQSNNIFIQPYNNFEKFHKAEA